MSYLLQFPAAAAYVVTGRLILGSSYTITFELQRDSNVDIYLTSDGGDELRYIVGTGWQIRFGGGYFSYPEADLIPPIGEKFTVTHARDGSTSNRSFQINSGTTVTKATSAVNLWFNNIGQGFGGVYQAFKLYKCTVTNPSNTTYNRVFDADASGGTGTILPNTLTGTNNGALTGAWPSDNSEWVFYSSGGAAYSDTLNGSTFTSSGNSIAVTRGYNSTLNGGTYTSSGNTLAANRGYSSVLNSAAFTSSGGNLTATRGYSSLLNGESYSYSGNELSSVIANGSISYSSTLLGASFDTSGGALQALKAIASGLNGGGYSHIGNNLTSSKAFYSALPGGIYLHSGSTMQSVIPSAVTITIEDYTITFANDYQSIACAADNVAATYAQDYISATWSN